MATKMKIPSIAALFRQKTDPGRIRIILESPGKILLVKQSERLGNIVLINSAIGALNKSFPGSKIDLMLPAKYCDLMKDDERINQIIPVYKRHYILRPWKLIQLLNFIRRQKYDLAIDCSDVNSHSSTGVIYTLLSRAVVTAGWKMNEKRVFDVEVPRYGDVPHASEMYLRLISGIFEKKMEGEPYFGSIGKVRFDTKSLVGINCGGRDSKRWSLQKFLEVGKKLAQQDISVEFILGPEEADIRQKFEQELPNSTRLLPPVSILELKRRIGSYDLFISSDSGPMHLAWCQRIPVIAIFQSSEIEKFKPLSPGSVSLANGNDISPDEICAIVLKTLNSQKVAK